MTENRFFFQEIWLISWPVLITCYLRWLSHPKIQSLRRFPLDTFHAGLYLPGSLAVPRLDTVGICWMNEWMNGLRHVPQMASCRGPYGTSSVLWYGTLGAGATTTQQADWAAWTTQAISHSSQATVVSHEVCPRGVQMAVPWDTHHWCLSLFLWGHQSYGIKASF